MKTVFFGHKWGVLTGFSNQNAMLKIPRGFNFASQQSQTFSRVLISRKWQKFREIAKFNLAKINPIKVNRRSLKFYAILCLLLIFYAIL